MKDRIILHCDLNNFFASVSLYYNPTLKNIPVAVCGDKESRRGIVLAKNEAAKKYGVKTAEPIFEARAKCPELVILPPMMEKYAEFSERARRIYSRYTDMIEPFGIDECWLDVTGSTVLFGGGEEIAQRIRKEIKSELGITVSVGVSFNKAFAKLGSDLKKPDAVTVISRQNFKNTVWPLPASSLLFAGNKTAQKLKAHGIYTVGDIAACSDLLLSSILGKNGLELKAYASGNDASPVVTPTDQSKPKSVGHTVTRAEDFCSYSEVWKEFLNLCQSISDTLRFHSLYAGGVTVHIRFRSLEVKEFSKSFKDTTNSAYILAQRGMELFKRSYSLTEPLRSVGIRAINLKDCESAVQEDMFGTASRNAEVEKIEDSVYEVRKKFGKSSVTRASQVDRD